MSRCPSHETMSYRVLWSRTNSRFGRVAECDFVICPMRVRTECPPPKESVLHSQLNVLKLTFQEAPSREANETSIHDYSSLHPQGDFRDGFALERFSTSATSSNIAVHRATK